MSIGTSLVMQMGAVAAQLVAQMELGAAPTG
jgi:hypothetical protein